jgi:hypothetical protein
VVQHRMFRRPMHVSTRLLRLLIAASLCFASRVTPVQTALRNCTGDEGGPFGFGDQVADPKPPRAAAAKSPGGERRGKVGATIPAGVVERGERKQTADQVSKAVQTMSKPGAGTTPGISSGDVLILPERHPAYRRREARLGSGMERENLAGDGKGKGASGGNREAESTDAPERGGPPRSSEEGSVMGLERRGWVTAVGVGSTGNGKSPAFNGRRQPSGGGTSRMMREYHVRNL